MTGSIIGQRTSCDTPEQVQVHVTKTPAKQSSEFLRLTAEHFRCRNNGNQTPASYFHSCYTWKGDDTRNNQPPLVLRPPAPAPLDSAWKSLSIDDQETSGEQFVQRIPSESKSIPLRTATTSSLDLKLSRYSFNLSLAKYAHSSLKSHKIRKLTL